jgi:PhzF family phenazine biosynthesis protein
MNNLSFYWVDVFTKVKFQGNPCTVVMQVDLLSQTDMQTIAKEMNLSETAFVMKSNVADFKAKYSCRN